MASSWCELEIRKQNSATDCKILSAVLVHMNGLGAALFSATYARIAFSSARVERKRPRLIWRAVRVKNQHSTKLIKEADVGVKCRCTRGCLSRQRWRSDPCACPRYRAPGADPTAWESLASPSAGSGRYRMLAVNARPKAAHWMRVLSEASHPQQLLQRLHPVPPRYRDGIEALGQFARLAGDHQQPAFQLVLHHHLGQQ